MVCVQQNSEHWGHIQLIPRKSTCLVQTFFACSNIGTKGVSALVTKDMDICLKDVTEYLSCVFLCSSVSIYIVRGK